MKSQTKAGCSTAPHDFQVELFDKLNDSPIQRKFRRLAPMPVGCVFSPWPGMTEEEARHHFRLMKKLGFTCLKQTMRTPEWPEERTLHLALDEGIIPFWYAEGGYEDITPALLKKLGLPVDMDVDEAIGHPKMVAYQHALIRARIGRQHTPVLHEMDEESKKDKDWVPSVVGTGQGHEISPGTIPFFIKWLQARYGTVAALKEAWNYRHVGIAEAGMEWRTWEEVEADIAGECRRGPAARQSSGRIS